MKRRFLRFVLALIPVLALFSQDGGSFGFGEDAAGGSFGFDSPESSSGPSVKLGGEVSAKLFSFTEDFRSSEKTRDIKPGDIFEGKLNFSASGTTAAAFINLKIKPDYQDPSSVISIDEAYVRLYLGPVDVEGGLRKLTWGRADSFGPLDVVNPIDYTDLSDMGDPRSIKLARPMLHVSWNIGSFSKLEGVFVPWFEGNAYALDGRWAAPQIAGIGPSLVGGLKAQIPNPPFSAVGPALDTWLDTFEIRDVYTNSNPTLSYAQGGLRFTTTIGSSDMGIQYYYGRLPRPAFTIDVADFVLPILGGGTPDPKKIHFLVNNNKYHQIGVDYAQVISGFNLRAEAGVNITEDAKGDDGSVYNSHLVWSLGFDRDLIWGINLNLQGNGLVRLMYDKIGSDPLTDTEAGKDLTSTRITAILSRKFFRDELELRATAIWGIEDKDFLIIPAIIWSKNDVKAEISAGIFGGDRAGEMGQYRDNRYVKTILTYSF